MPRCPSKVSGRTHGMAARRTSLHHRDLTTHPGAGVLDRFAWSRVIRLSRLEQVKDVLRARRRPKSQEMMIRISEGPTAANRHETRIPDLRKDHWPGAPTACVRPTLGGLRGQAASSTVASFQHQGGSSVSCGPARHPPPCTRQFRAFTLRGRSGYSPRARLCINIQPGWLPAASSSLIGPAIDQLLAAAPSLDQEPARLLPALAVVPEHRARRGVRHRLAVILGQPVHGQVVGPAAGMRLFTRACARERTAGEGGVRSGASGPASLHRSGLARLSRWRTRRWSCRVRWRVVRSGSC